MRCQLRDGPVKGIVEASVVCCRRKNRLCGGDKRQCLRDVQWREMYGRAQLIQDLRRDELVRAELGPSVHNEMAYSHGHGRDMFLDFFGDGGERKPLLLVNALARDAHGSLR